MPSGLGIGRHWGPGKDTHSTLGPELQEACGWPVWIRQRIHGTHGSGAGFYEQVERLVAKDWNKVPQETCNAKVAQSGLGRRAADTTRRPTTNVFAPEARSVVFPKHDHHQPLV